MILSKRLDLSHRERKEKKLDKQKPKEPFLDWSMYNQPIVNGYTPKWWNSGVTNIAYDPLEYNDRSQAFYNQGFYPNMALNPQVIGCGGRRMPCLGGTQETVPVISAPVDV